MLPFFEAIQPKSVYLSEVFRRLQHTGAQSPTRD